MVYEVEAGGFLRKMVRSLVGGLVAVGRGALSVDDLREALEARDRRRWPPPAEACGLTLVRVDYPNTVLA
jgi:tRNA pseudouridine38-40 synthase